MPAHRARGILLLIALALVTAFFWWGVPALPFHPDESTQLYMSADLDTLFAHPGELIWHPGQPLDARARYRLLDAPLTRYWLGLGRSLSGQPALQTDWNWSATWEENVQAGALPADALLWAGRFAVTALLTATTYLMFLSGKAIAGYPGGLLTAALFATNALVLLHGRRAMAEGALLLGISLIIWLVLARRGKPVALGLAMALAFNAKQSALAFLPVVLLAGVIPEPLTLRPQVKKSAYSLAVILLVFAAVTWLLNPFLWQSPIQAIQAAAQARLDFVQGQVETFQQLAPDQVLESPLERAAVLIAQVFLNPPAAADVGNYLAATDASTQAYLAIPGHNLFRGFAWGMLFFTLALFGVITAGIQVVKERLVTVQSRSLAILLLATGILFAALVYTVPIPYQRYALPLVPFTILWSAFGISKIVDVLQKAIRQKKPAQTL